MKKRIIKDYLMIAFGALIMGLSIGVFMIDTRVVPGGVSGIAMALHFLSDESIPVGLMLWIMNIPLFIWGVKELGWGFAIRTIFGFTISAFSIDLFHGDVPGLTFLALNKSEAIVDLQQNDFLFLIVIGAVLLGVGMAFVLKHKGTTGGADVVAAILQKRYGYKPGNAIMVMNILIILFATLIIYQKQLSHFRPPISLAFYALLLTFIISRIVDIFLDGFDYARSAMIISDKSKEIADAIMHKLSRGATALNGRGLYLNSERDIIMTIITRRELTLLEELIRSIDPKAFVVISTVHEVLGEGFKRRI
ncbi:MAG: YitT family protein [Calditrichae bacterium]|nr:YitT family protein [Calditrichota bacterium]MCB9058476.1 YitT family protein [Calditrichia bacterium]